MKKTFEEIFEINKAELPKVGTYFFRTQFLSLGYFFSISNFFTNKNSCRALVYNGEEGGEGEGVIVLEGHLMELLFNLQKSVGGGGAIIGGKRIAL